MHAIGIAYDGDTYCFNCADEDEHEGDLIFANESGAEDLTCSACGEALGEAAGIEG